MTRTVAAWAAAGVLTAGLLGGIVAGRSKTPVTDQPQATGVPYALQSVAQEAIGGSDRRFWIRRHGGALVASGRGIATVFDSAGVRVSVAGGRLDLRLTSIGRGGRLAALSPVTPVAEGDVVRYRRGGLVEWYRNGPFGLEQGFTLGARPRGEAGALTLALSVAGTLAPRQAGGGVVFASSTGAVLVRDGELSVLDASGRHLPATLSLSGSRLLVRVWDRGARYPLRIDPFIQQGKKLVGSPKGDFGASVALSADGATALVGEDEAVWVFTHSGSSWKGTKLTGSGETGRSGSGFGVSVALSADATTALVGGPYDNGEVGAVWVFTRSGSTWTQQGKKLTGRGEIASGEPGRGGRFGSSVALSADGSVALIGGVYDNRSAGAAWVFTRSGSTWTQQGKKLTGGDETGPGEFGFRVALSADATTALIGGPYDNGPYDSAGAAWVFTRSGSAWKQQGKKLTDANHGGFGWSVALSDAGNIALIGVPFDNGSAGAAWVFARSGSTWARAGRKLTAKGKTGYRLFGTSVALSADARTALIGGPGDRAYVGAAWVFTRSGAGWAQQGEKLTSKDEIVGVDGDFGDDVALSDDASVALISGPNHHGGHVAGAAWVFTPRPPRQNKRFSNQ